MPFGIEFRNNGYFVEVEATPLFWSSSKNMEGLRITGSIRNKEDVEDSDTILVSFALMFRLQFGGCHAEVSIEQGMSPLGAGFEYDTQNIHALASEIVQTYRRSIGFMFAEPESADATQELIAYVGDNEFHQGELGLAVAPVVNGFDVLDHVFGDNVPTDTAQSALEHLGDAQGLWLSAFREAMAHRATLYDGDTEERMAAVVAKLRESASQT